MYQFLLPVHSVLRWVLILGILYCIVRGIFGARQKTDFNKTDNFFRSFTSGISHLQLIIGFILYFKSPVTSYFRSHTKEALEFREITFFGIVHITLMIIAVLLITIGASKAKRATASVQKHRQLLLWFSLAFIIILIAVPWPFSPLASRPFFRPF